MFGSTSGTANAMASEFSAIVTDVTNLKYKRNPYLYTREYFETPSFRVFL